jgi:hypothetical protein
VARDIGINVEDHREKQKAILNNMEIAEENMSKGNEELNINI